MGSPAVSEEEAREALPESLNVSGSRLVLCADNSLERLCYAFDCIDRRGEPVRICVDAGTGKQFKIEV